MKPIFTLNDDIRPIILTQPLVPPIQTVTWDMELYIIDTIDMLNGRITFKRIEKE